MDVISVGFGAGQGPFPMSQLQSCQLALGYLPLGIGNVFLQGSSSEIFFLKTLLDLL